MSLMVRLTYFLWKFICTAMSLPGPVRPKIYIVFYKSSRPWKNQMDMSSFFPFMNFTGSTLKFSDTWHYIRGFSDQLKIYNTQCYAFYIFLFKTLLLLILSNSLVMLIIIGTLSLHGYMHPTIFNISLLGNGNSFRIK